MEQLEVSFRLAEEGDTEVVCNLQRAAIRRICSTTYGEEMAERWGADLRASDYTSFIRKRQMTLAILNNRIVGFGCLDVSGNEIKKLYVSPDFSRRGIGSALIQYLEEQAKKEGCSRLKVYSTENAVTFYRRHGYSVLDPNSSGVFRRSIIYGALMSKNIANSNTSTASIQVTY